LIFAAYKKTFLIKKNIKTTIGRYESVSFPSFELGNIHAKIDTGADSSAIHCSEIKVIKKNGVYILAVKFLDKHHLAFNNIIHEFSNYKCKRVKNSFGKVEERYIIKSIIKIGEREILTDLSLAKRSSMNYAVLLGRKFLKGKFLVDVAKRYLLSDSNIKINL